MKLWDLPLAEVLEAWDEYDKRGTDLVGIRALCQLDRFYLLVKVMGRTDMLHPWIYSRCREVEKAPDGYLDLWAREHYKSTIITIGGSIQELLKDSSLTIGIFSHTSPDAKSFLAVIKRELENNLILKAAFPDVLWENPWKDAPAWSLDGGIILRRQTNPKECSVEAHGLIDGMPTGKHFGLLVYDDVVTEKSVSTPEQIEKATTAWELSDNLGKSGGRKWHIGTRYSYADSYESILKRGSVIPRIYTATHNGKLDGKPVLFTQEEWENKQRDQGPNVIACHAAGTKVLMADWTYKNIEDVAIGESVVGFELRKGVGNFPLLKPVQVLGVNRRTAQIRCYETELGNKFYCTRDHKWWTRRSGCDGHSVYAQLGELRKQDLKTLARITNLQEECTDRQRMLWQYLAGILDGEGSLGTPQITITQSDGHNPLVCERIESVLAELKIPFSVYQRKQWGRSKPSRLYVLAGGRVTKHRIVLNANPAKASHIVRGMYGHLGGSKSTSGSEKVVSFSDCGEGMVYNIQTETGNYIANGFASKNCQMMQDPLSGKQRMFDVGDFGVYEVRPEVLNVYILCDPARSKKKDSANTAVAVVGVDYAMNKYLLDGVNHKMDLKERWEAIRNLYNKWVREMTVCKVEVGYEKYGAQADLDYFEERMKAERVRFDIKELAWPHEGDGSKVDRVQRIGPDLRNHRIYLPYPTNKDKLTSLQRDMERQGYGYRIAQMIRRKDENGVIYDLTEQLKVQTNFFPYGGLKDLVDAYSRIHDMEVTAPSHRTEEDVLEPEYT